MKRSLLHYLKLSCTLLWLFTCPELPRNPAVSRGEALLVQQVLKALWCFLSSKRVLEKA